MAEDCGKLVNPLIVEGQVHGNGTTSNTVLLGLVEAGHDKEWVEANREKLVKLYLVCRLGQVNDFALLVSPKSGWITDQTLSVSGDFSMV